MDDSRKFIPGSSNDFSRMLESILGPAAPEGPTHVPSYKRNLAAAQPDNGAMDQFLSNDTLGLFKGVNGLDPQAAPPAPVDNSAMDNFLNNDTLGLFKGVAGLDKSSPSVSPVVPPATSPTVNAAVAEPVKFTQTQKSTAQQPAVEQPNTTQPSGPDELDKLLNQRKDALSNINMLDSASRIGYLLAGQGHIEAPKDQFTGLKELANLPVKDVMTKAEMHKAKQQMDDEKAKSDPNSELSKFTRASAQDALRKIGKSELAGRLGSMSAKQVEDAVGQYNLNNMYNAYEAQQNRLELAKTRAAEKAEAAKEKMDIKDASRLDQANKMITASMARNNTAFGRSANVIRSAEAIEQLIHGGADLDQRQIKELAAGLDSMLTSGASTVSGRAGLVPSSASGDIAKIEEYITNQPKGSGQRAFVKKLAETVHREKELAKAQISQESRKMLSSFHDIKQRNPANWGLMLREHNLDPEMFDTSPESSSPKSFSADQENGIKAVMEHNGISREEAVQALKDAGKL